MVGKHVCHLTFSAKPSVWGQYVVVCCFVSVEFFANPSDCSRYAISCWSAGSAYKLDTSIFRPPKSHDPVGSRVVKSHDPVRSHVEKSHDPVKQRIEKSRDPVKPRVQKSHDPVKPRIEKSRDPVKPRVQKSRDPVELRGQKSHDPVGRVKKICPTPLPDNFWSLP